MATVVAPSRNPVVAAAFAALRKSERAEKKAKPEPEPKKTNAKPPRAAKRGRK